MHTRSSKLYMCKLENGHATAITLEGSKSTVWKHFGFPARDESFWRLIKISCTVFTCKLCGKVLKYSGNTTNLFYYLQHSHHTEFKAMQGLDSKKKQERMTKMKDLRQGRSVDSFKATTPIPKSSPKWNKFSEVTKAWY